MEIYNEDCISGCNQISDGSIGLMICDPPFGIHEKSFDNHYNRKQNVIDGYVEAPQDYHKFSYEWISKAIPKLTSNGSMYIISGWSNSDIIGSVIRELNLHVRNKIIWHFNFGVNTKNKFVTSHYEIFYLTKSKKIKPVFNTYCRFGQQHRDENNKSLLYQDKQSVWQINKEYKPGEVKNQNKLPEELVRKMILYSSNPGDIICDFFLGNFTTAIVSKKTSRIPMGFEINKKMFDIGLQQLINTRIEVLEPVENILPLNQGKKIDAETIEDICNYFEERVGEVSKKQIVKELMVIHKRGKFSISNIINAHCKNFQILRRTAKRTLSDDEIINFSDF